MAEVFRAIAAGEPSREQEPEVMARIVETLHALDEAKLLAETERRMLEDLYRVILDMSIG